MRATDDANPLTKHAQASALRLLSSRPPGVASWCRTQANRHRVPHTGAASRLPSGALFELGDVDELIDVLHGVRRTAAPEHSVA